MAQVIWTKRAFSQLERNIRFIKEERGVQFAEIVLNRILSSTKLLEKSPNIGTIEPQLVHKPSEYRFLVVYSYKIIYRKADETKVVISRVFHTSRDPRKLKGV